MLGTINIHGDRGSGSGSQVAKMRINGVTDKAALVTLATGLAAYTSGNIGRQAVSDFATGNPAAPDNDTNLDKRGIIYFQDTDGSVHSITISGWDTTAKPVDDTLKGDRIKAVDVAAITALINAATGKSYIGLWGKYLQQA